MAKRLLNPRLDAEEQKVYIKKAAEHNERVRREHEKFERRIRLCKVYTKADFIESFNSSRVNDQRMLLTLCSKE